MPRLAPQERKRQIVDAARHLFGRLGYHQTNIADIASKLGIGHGTFYRYFKNKRDILSHVVNDLTGRLAAMALTEDPSAPETLEQYRAQVERLGQLLYSIFIEDAAAARVVFVETLSVDEEMRRQIRRALDLMGEFTGQYLAHGVQKGYLRADLDIQSTALMLNAMIIEGVRRVALMEDPRAAAKRWQAAYIALMFHGISA